MVPKLYHIPGSPPCRSVFICAKALGIKYEGVFVNLLTNEHLGEDYIKKNPLHTVPALEDDDGFIVVDSHAIMAYLVSKYGKDDSLYPKNDLKRRTTIDQRLYFDASILCAKSLNISKYLGFFNIQPTQEKLDALKDAYQDLEQILINNKTDYIAGNTLSIADFSIFTTVTSADIFVPYADFPNIVNYVKRIEKLPCSEENKEGLKGFNELFKAKLNK